ncbi:hypothetical protein EV385_0584 [Krasilnikovia cinnamomea]|uniref:Uncharacterized protein n=1 Tax=Krasilnikovia cinnamomea TaxID=349313 RepID=A0A4Q7ZFI4_9ACTN|nr:hypothetical protein [Krasilnikovia cinnamomea]RZU48855.1 hypothetical protein EV385_0584 [Krasilnikovia cinnamomea]
MSIDVRHSLKPNLVLVNQRQAAGWDSRKRAARELHRLGCEHGIKDTPTVPAIEKAMYRHETGRVAVTDPIYRRLYCLAYRSTPHDLFGEVSHHDDSDRPRFSLRSHKFVPAYIGPTGAAHLREQRRLEPAAGQWSDCDSGSVEHPEGQCELFVWPCGVAIFHLIEDVELGSLAAFAAWRRVSYSGNSAWAAEELATDVGPVDAESIYVFGAHWLTAPAWSAGTLDAALRILSTPAVLLHRDRPIDDSHLAHAELIEQSLLAEDYDHAGIESFGLRGISAAYASWSGVVYHPLAPERSLTESELVACELATQSAWAYTDAINRQTEQGRDPSVADEYGWRYLRGIRSRLTTSRALETGQHQMMRKAILRTSDLLPKLEHAIESLRDTDRG